MNSELNELLTSLPKSVTKHIKHLERMRQDFVANVSHELRTPLTVIHGYLETLIEQNSDETNTLHKIYSQMQQQTLRMENLINDLLLLSHLENHEDENATGKPVSVAELLTSICADAKELSGESQHVIECYADENILLIGFEDELRSLFSNIIFNAVKYTPANGQIIIEWCSKNKQGYFKVTDTGIGIADEHIPRLTERFYRVDPARSRNSGGTGLGLAIAKHVLIHHQGNLEIESEIEKGSVFTCVFPESRIATRF